MKVDGNTLGLLQDLHSETEDWEYALHGERPSLVEARARAARRLGEGESGYQQDVVEALSELRDEAADWASALGGEREGLDELLASVDTHIGRAGPQPAI